MKSTEKVGVHKMHRFAKLHGKRIETFESPYSVCANILRSLGYAAGDPATAKKICQKHKEVIWDGSKKYREPKEPRPAKTRVKSISNNVASDAFLSTYEWRKVRMVALKKYGAKCQCCGATPATGAVINVDHIKPRKIYPDLALDVNNLQVLCHECNHGKGNWDMTDWRKTETA